VEGLNNKIRTKNPHLYAAKTVKNYPLENPKNHYCIHLVVDSSTDPANEFVASILKEGYPGGVEIRVSVLKKPLPNCSLKVSAQIQALTELDANIDVIALIDADAAPAANWLRVLVEPHNGPFSPTTGFIQDMQDGNGGKIHRTVRRWRRAFSERL
jgi:hypothetical protein